MRPASAWARGKLPAHAGRLRDRTGMHGGAPDGPAWGAGCSGLVARGRRARGDPSPPRRRGRKVGRAALLAACMPRDRAPAGGPAA